MESRNLYRIQDTEGDMWVVAETWQAALEKWRDRVLSENPEMTREDMYEPLGVQFVCDSRELIL